MRHPCNLLLALLFATVGCASNSGTHSETSRAPDPATASADPAATSQSNGRSIFQTGRDSNGTRITAKSHPLYSSCAACHGASGAGGKHLKGGAVSADLRHGALVSGQSTPYTLALLERAISTGIDNEGKPLDPVMPRWTLSKRDLHDVANYVFTQLK